MRAVLLLFLLALALPVGALSPDPDHIVRQAQDAADRAVADPGAAAQDPGSVVLPILDPDEPAASDPGTPRNERDPGFADRVRAAFQDDILVVGLGALALSALSLSGFALVTRYISPKEALKNPQRAMLYGFVRGNPGVHLKKLSEEFAMKTSSILWHIRKLESAELVRSERANGFRVFYPVDGGVEIKRVSRAITALQNRNARNLYVSLERRPGQSPVQLSERLAIHGGTVRWHLRKLREFGLIEELLRDDGSTYYPTTLGRRTLQTMEGSPVETRVPMLTATPAMVAE